MKYLLPGLMTIVTMLIAQNLYSQNDYYEEVSINDFGQLELKGKINNALGEYLFSIGYPYIYQVQYNMTGDPMHFRNSRNVFEVKEYGAFNNVIEMKELQLANTEGYNEWYHKLTYDHRAHILARREVALRYSTGDLDYAYEPQNWIDSHYDDNDRLIKREHKPPNGSTENVFRTDIYHYEGNSKDWVKKESKNKNGEVVRKESRTYNSAGKLVQTVEYSLYEDKLEKRRTTKYTYRDSGHLLKKSKYLHRLDYITGWQNLRETAGSFISEGVLVAEIEYNRRSEVDKVSDSQAFLNGYLMVTYSPATSGVSGISTIYQISDLQGNRSDVRVEEIRNFDKTIISLKWLDESNRDLLAAFPEDIRKRITWRDLVGTDYLVYGRMVSEDQSIYSEAAAIIYVMNGSERDNAALRSPLEFLFPCRHGDPNCSNYNKVEVHKFGFYPKSKSFSIGNSPLINIGDINLEPMESPLR
jgi:hypothetical protein